MRSAAAVLIGVLALACGAMASDYTWALNNDGNSFYTITGAGSVAGQNPTVTLPYGATLHLDITSTSSHPVCVQTTNAVTGQSNYANIVPPGTGCVETGTFDITLPSITSGTNAIYLHCKFHGFAITINLAADYTWALSNSGFTYSITGNGAVGGTNPTVTLPFGKSLHVDVTTISAHAVCVQTNNAVTGVSNYANVVPANPTCIQTTGTLDIALPASGSGVNSIYLHCVQHTFAITINFVEPAVSSTAVSSSVASSSVASSSTADGAISSSSTGAAAATASSSTAGAAASSSAAPSSTAGAAASSSTGGVAPDYSWNLVNPNAGSFFYTITGAGAVAGNNPTVTLPFGKTLHLSISADANHPVCVQRENSITGVSNYANVVPANPTCVQAGSMDITLPAANSGITVLYLHCEYHSFAVTINLSNGAATAVSSTAAAGPVASSSTGINAASGSAPASAAVVLFAAALAVALRA